MTRQTKGAATKQRIVESMLELVQIHGYSGAGLNTVLAHSGAPKGSLYFHFPDGKEELGELAVGLAAQQFEALITAALHGSPTDGSSAPTVAAVVAALAELLETNDFRVGCPVSVVALEMGAASERLRTACALAYESWIVPVAGFLEARGHDAAVARSLASSVISLMEGAMIVARARRDVQPLTDAGHTLTTLLDLPSAAATS